MSPDALAPVMDFALIMGTAAIVALFFHRLRLPLAPGFIIAGLLLSVIAAKYDLIQTFASIDVMSQIGMVLLLFTIGLQFSLRKLRECGMLIIFIGIIEVSLCITAGYWIGIALGWSPMEAMALGGIISISSTVIVVTSLDALGPRWKPLRFVVLGVLIVEDAVAVILISFFSTVREGVPFGVGDILFVGLKIFLFILVSLAIGMYIVPGVVDHVTATRKREVIIATVLALCFGMAAFAGILGLSTSIGAFVMGIMVGGSRSFKLVHGTIQPIRDLFIALFFITIGFYVAPADLISVLPLTLFIVGAFMAIKTLAATAASVLGGRDWTSAFRIGVSMLAIGEFSLIIAQTSMATGLVHVPILAIAVLASFITSALLPYMVKGGEAVIVRSRAEDPGSFQVYSCLTAGWLDRIANRMPDEMKAATRKFALKMTVSVVIIALTVLSLNAVRMNGAAISETSGYGESVIYGVAVLITIIILIVQAVIMARRINNFIEMLSKHIVSSSRTAEAVGRHIIVHLMRNIAGITLAVGLLIMVSFFIPGLLMLRTFLQVGVLSLFIAIAWILGDSLHALNHRVEDLFHTSLMEDKKTKRRMKPIIKELKAEMKGPPSDEMGAGPDRSEKPGSGPG